MYKARVSALLAAAALASGCAQTRVVDSWRTQEPIRSKPDKVAVVVALPDALMRQAIEVDVAGMLRKKGTPAVASSTLPGLGGGIRGEIDTAQATAVLKQAGADGVIVSFYSGGGVADSYERSDYWADYVGTGAGYYWGRPYFTDVYVVRKGPGYSDIREVTYIESSYYDLEAEQIVWRIVTETKDNQHTDTAADVAAKIASQMSTAGLN